MKRAFTYALSLALLLSLTACNKPQTEQPDTSQAEPEVTTNQVDTEPEQATVAQLSHTEQPQEEILQGDELIAVFQLIYDACSGCYSNKDEQLGYELSELTSYEGYSKSKSGKAYPADYVEQYKEWRPLDEDVEDLAEPASSGGTSSNQATTPTETVQAPSDSGSPAQGTEAQGGEAPASGGNPSGWIDPSTQTIDHTQTQLEGRTKIPDGTTVHSYDPTTGLGAAGGLGVGVHTG